MAEVKKTTVKVDRQNTRAKFDLNTFNEADRTVEVTFATETPVRSYDWEIGRFIEVLSCDPLHVDLTRLKSGAPVLDNHDRYSATRKAVVGVVEDAWVTDGECRAKIRFSNSEDDTDLMNKVKDGIVTGISAGYDVFAYELTRAVGENELPTYKAINWMPTEISFVPVQADINSRVRSAEEDSHEATVSDVTPEAEAETPAAENTDQVQPEEENNNNVNNDEMTEAEKLAAAAEEKTRAAAAKKEERDRVVGIQSKVRSLGLPSEFADTLIADETITVDMAATRAITEWEKENPFSPKPNANQQEAEKGKIRSAMANALVIRIDPNAAKVMGEDNVRAAAEFKGQNLLRFAEESLIRSGVRTAGFSQREIATLALGGRVRGLHHTTDFPLLLMDTVNRTLLASYQLQARTFEQWARRTTIGDFRPVSRVRLSEILGDLEKVREGEEYKYGTLSEAGETYQLAKYGKIIGITWEAIINDDLSAFTRIPQAFAAKAAQLQSDLVYNTILSGGFATMSDGNALFSAAHGNFVGTAANQTTGGSALSEASLTLAYTAFMEQKGPDGSFITVSPKFLVVGPKNAFLAMKMTSANYTPAKQTDIPVASLVGLTVIVEPRITNYAWFLIADPNQVDTVEYAFLAGEEELFIEPREGFNIDGIEVKARLVFAAKAIDWRGMYRNNGAAPA